MKRICLTVLHALIGGVAVSSLASGYSFAAPLVHHYTENESGFTNQRESSFTEDFLTGRGMVGHLGFTESSYLGERSLVKRLEVELAERAPDTVHLIPVMGRHGLVEAFSRLLRGANPSLRQHTSTVALLSRKDWQNPNVQELCEPFDHVIVIDSAPVDQVFSELINASLATNQETSIYAKEGGAFAQSALLKTALRHRYSGNPRTLRLQLSAGYLPKHASLEGGIMLATGIAARYEQISPYLRGTETYFDFHDELAVAGQLLLGHQETMKIDYVSIGDQRLDRAIRLYQEARLHVENWHLHTSPQGNRVLFHLDHDELQVWLDAPNIHNLERTGRGDERFGLVMDGDTLEVIDTQGLKPIMVADPVLFDRNIFAARYATRQELNRRRQHEEPQFAAEDSDYDHDNVSGKKRRIRYESSEYNGAWEISPDVHEFELSEILIQQAFNWQNFEHVFRLIHRDELRRHLHAVREGSSDLFLKPIPDSRSDFYLPNQTALMQGKTLRQQVEVNYRLFLQELEGLIRKSQTGQAIHRCIGIFAK